MIYNGAQWRATDPLAVEALQPGFGAQPYVDMDTDWLRTNGVNTSGAATKVITFDRLWKKVRPGTFGKIQVG